MNRRSRRRDNRLATTALFGCALASIVALTLACTAEPAPEPEPPATSEAPDAGAAAMAGLPDGHPRIETPTPASVFPPVDPETGTGDAALTWTVPEGWVNEPPSNEMRRAQYRVPGGAGEAECVVFYFGPGRGGEPMQNAERWASQFRQPDGTDPVEAMHTETIDVGGTSVLLVETTGVYGVDPMSGGSGRAMSHYMLLGAIAQGPDANWFFKFTGPEQTVQGQRDAFLEMVRSLTPGSS